MVCFINTIPVCVQEFAYEESQKYKEGKYILEKAVVMKVRWWLGIASGAAWGNVSGDDHCSFANTTQEGCW